jgi:uncharacterized protein YjbJ (UPF0337 family)
VLWEGISIVELLGVKEQAANLNSSWALFGFLLCPDEARVKQFEEEKLQGWATSLRGRICILQLWRYDMKALPWIVAGVGIGVGVTLLLRLTEPEAEYATGSDAVESAASKTYGWGTKTRVGGKMRSAAGAIKEGVGRLSGDQDLADEGAADRVVGNVKDAAGKVGNALGQTIADLNR